MALWISTVGGGGMTATPTHRDAIEAIAAQLERLATTVRTLIPEPDPVDGKDWLDPLRPVGCDAEHPSMYQMPDGSTSCRCVVCGRCGKHTGNSHQGHYWSMCKVWLKQGRGLNESMRDFHFCCPDDCELEAVTIPAVTR